MVGASLQIDALERQGKENGLMANGLNGLMKANLIRISLRVKRVVVWKKEEISFDI